jgi:hypothetical protein
MLRWVSKCYLDIGVLFGMVQTSLSGLEQTLLRIGSIAFITRSITAIVFTLFHATSKDPASQLLEFTAYDNSDSYKGY